MLVLRAEEKYGVLLFRSEKPNRPRGNVQVGASASPVIGHQPLRYSAVPLFRFEETSHRPRGPQAACNMGLHSPSSQQRHSLSTVTDDKLRPPLGPGVTLPLVRLLGLKGD